MRILIVKPSSLGDIVHTFPAVGLLARAMPGTHVGWVVNSDLAPLVRLYPSVDEVIEFPRREWRRLGAGGGLAPFLKKLRTFRADIAVDFQGLLRSGLICRFSGARWRVGFQNAREGAGLFYSERVRVPANIAHAVERNLALVRIAFGVYDSLPPVPALPVPEAVQGRVDGLLAESGDSDAPLLAVVPGARWQTKQWPAAEFAAAVDCAVREIPELRVCLIGGPADRRTAEEIVRKCKVARPLDLCGCTDLVQMVAMLQQTDVVLTNDTGPMHVAAYLEKPVVAVFGPTDPDRTGPYGENHTVFRGACTDAPCFRKECSRTTEDCWQGVSAAAVGAAVAGRLRALRGA